LAPAYDFYSFKIMPCASAKRSPDAEVSYRYLAESIRVHPDQEALKELMEEAGLEKVEYFNLTARRGCPAPRLQVLSPSAAMSSPDCCSPTTCWLRRRLGT
jgi:hypothetical protein